MSSIEVKNLPVNEITCANCEACCCSLEVMLLSETGVPDRHVYVDRHGKESMLRFDDGWCSALDRDTLMCTIYDNRPWVCRIFEMGSNECIEEREEKM
jgi:Fe-S-cluster containining protein